MSEATETERLRRWRLVLGGGAAEGTGCTLSERDGRLDRAMGALYDSDRKGGLGASAPSVPRWLGDIRDYFPASVVQVMQRDAFERLDLKRMLTEPEMLEAVQARDISLVDYETLYTAKRMAKLTTMDSDSSSSDGARTEHPKEKKDLPKKKKKKRGKGKKKKKEGAPDAP